MPPRRNSRSSKSNERKDEYSRTPLTMTTLENIATQGYPTTRGTAGNSSSFYHDLTSPKYTWLLPGWIAEERILSSGRVYKYYYDPAGRQYRFKYEVLDQWERVGLIVLDS
ncbi:unnamed protein product [Amaranthus hypochondriacus]